MTAFDQLPEDLKAPPGHLSERSQGFFVHIIASGGYDAPARSLLITYCEILDRMEEIRVKFQTEERYFTDKHGQPREHPAAKEYRGLINEKGKVFRLLGWDQAPPEGGAQMSFPGIRRVA